MSDAKESSRNKPKILPCPACGASVELEGGTEWHDQLEFWIMCKNPACGCVRVGDTEMEECIHRWNSLPRRTTVEPGDETAYMLNMSYGVVRRQRKLLVDILDDVGDKHHGSCPVCSTLTHKHWCWYPQLLRCLGRPLDSNDVTFLENKEEEEHAIISQASDYAGLYGYLAPKHIAGILERHYPPKGKEHGVYAAAHCMVSERHAKDDLVKMLYAVLIHLGACEMEETDACGE